MYFDTSVVLSLYVEDAFTPQAEAFYDRHAPEATVSAWVDLEVKSALCFLVRTKRLTLEGAQLALKAYEEDRAQGVYKSVLLTPQHFAVGALALDLEGPLRAGDALHLGAAKAAGLPLVTSDKTLHDVAEVNSVASSYLPDFSS